MRLKGPRQLVLQLPVDLVEDHALPAQRVDLLPQAAVRRDRLVELLEPLVEAVLQDPDLLRDRLRSLNT